MRVYLINLERRKDRLKAMEEQAAGVSLELERVTALDAGTADRDAVNSWFATGGPLGEIPAGDKACLLSHRAAWERFIASGEAHAVFLEDDVRLSKAAGPMLASDAWIPDGVPVVKLEHYGPPAQRVLLADIHALSMARPRQAATALGEDFRMGRMLSRHTGGAAYILSRQAAEILLAEPRFDLPVDHLLFNPNNSRLFARLKPWQLVPAIARQQEFVGEKSDIEKTRAGLRAFGWAYIRRELMRFGYDLKLLPRQIAALLSGAKFVAVKTAD
jgi:glycosyl transferase family 25